jgi:hypothetical protein
MHGADKPIYQNTRIIDTSYRLLLEMLYGETKM